ncbi:ExbD/TolR family protein [Planctomyces sp. SH-PL14]|uniref:ExbD/TolR family protein n=1 Tax=Planctomyces sp. SH-PL14 TaxID=1632864 RepID=UPI00078C1EDB|nr:biopolymer transporter ExbD [Planctomyces sp. SH-PL14]AMV20970.1 Biopolymer transport protein ExbD/TolR [Planctomyces sp. SH-PL14]
MSGSVGSDNVEPNLTPILDMVFQLITFFMLVINFKGAALDLSLQLPVLGSARPLETEQGEALLYLNINSQGQLTLYNEVKDLRQWIAEEAREAIKQEKAKDKNFDEKKDGLPTMVVIRADRSTPFRILNDVLNTCQGHGYRRFSLNAMNKAE